MIRKRLINAITNPNPVCSHCYTLQILVHDKFVSTKAFEGNTLAMITTKEYNYRIYSFITETQFYQISLNLTKGKLQRN
jgi:hypothetical protein